MSGESRASRRSRLAGGEALHEAVRHPRDLVALIDQGGRRGSRQRLVDRFFRRAEPDQVVVILKVREPTRILTAIGTPTDNRWHLQSAQRWVVHYNIYLNDRRWGRLFVRVCPYFPFSVRVCLNQHHQAGFWWGSLRALIGASA